MCNVHLPAVELNQFNISVLLFLVTREYEDSTTLIPCECITVIRLSITQFLNISMFIYAKIWRTKCIFCTIFCSMIINHYDDY